MEFLREIGHLRPRTNTFGCIFRIKTRYVFCNTQYFNDRGFFNLHTPIITASDAEGAGAMFQVTTLDMNNLQEKRMVHNTLRISLGNLQILPLAVS